MDYVVSCLIAHTAAGTLGPVNAGTGSVPFTTAQIIGDNFDLLPPAVWRKDIAIADLKGFMSLYKVSQDHPAVHTRIYGSWGIVCRRAYADTRSTTDLRH